MDVLQRTTKPMVVANRQTYLIPQATSAQRTDSGLIAVLQRTTMPRVVARPQGITDPIAKSARPYRRNTPRLGGNASYIPERKEVKMIFEGPHEVKSGRLAREKYALEAKKPF